MKRLSAFILILLALATVAPAWDFLWREGGQNLATRSADPFARLDRVARLDDQPVRWAREGDGFRFFVVWCGEEWTCRDGTIQPSRDELPKTISKLDLLLVLREMDKTDEFVAWLDASGLRIFWDAAQDLATDHPLYEQALESVQEVLGLTDEEVEAVLERIAK
jgi:hypothetical protein